MTASAFISRAETGLQRFATPNQAVSSRASQSEIILDLSRLFSRVLHPTPTGVDRVEMAYAQGLLRRVPDRLRFAAIHPSGIHGRLPPAAAVDFIHLTAERWQEEGQRETALRRWRRAATACMTLLPRPSPAEDGQRIYLKCSPRGLEQRGLIGRVLEAEQARFVPFVHDLIPIEYPEYARPDGARLLRRKLQTITALASAIIVNSEATKQSLVSHLETRGRSARVCVAPLGTSLELASVDGIGEGCAVPARPYFVAVATIEPRKNHLLLLHVWRRFIAMMKPDEIPKLILVGRRGWENEMVLDLLDRTPGFPGIVEERSRVSDRELIPLIRDARALLMPSFAEGYGLPVADAFTLGTPVIASDLPAHREVGNDAADYLDPLDGIGWLNAVLDYTRPDSPRRSAQIERIGKWRRPLWDAHIRTILDFIAEVQK